MRHKINKLMNGYQIIEIIANILQLIINLLKIILNET